MPRLFKVGRALFGNAWMNDNGSSRSSRRQVGRRMDHFCQVMRDKYPTSDPCPPHRHKTCYRIMLEAFATTDAARAIAPVAYLKGVLAHAVNDERTDAAMKACQPTNTTPFANIFQKETACPSTSTSLT